MANGKKLGGINDEDQHNTVEEKKEKIVRTKQLFLGKRKRRRGDRQKWERKARGVLKKPGE